MDEHGRGPQQVLSLPLSQPRRWLAERLLTEGRITREQHDAALAYEKRNACRIEDALIDIDALNEQELLKYLAAVHKTRFVSTERLIRADLDRTTLDRIPRKLAERLNVVPVVFDAKANSLSFVTADPDNVDAIDQVQKGAGVREVRALVARPAAVQAAVAKFYRGDANAFFAIENKRKRDSSSIEFASNMSLTLDTGDTPIANMAKERTVTPSAHPFALSGPERKVSPLTVEADTQRMALPGLTMPEMWPSSDAALEMLNVLITLLENSRKELRGHSAHVARLIRKMAERIGLSPSDQNALAIAAYLHDLGKSSAYHLTALNVGEYEAARAVAEKAYAMPMRLLASAKLPTATVAALAGMYERYDGKGLPQKAQAKDISLGARLLAIADTYVDLTENAKNPFRATLSPVEACDVMAKYKGTIFDPHLVDLFRQAIAGEDLKARILSNRHLALLVDPDPEETTVLELRMIEEGFDVQIARTSAQAWEILEVGKIELVVSELDLGGEPGMAATGGDGLALLEASRKMQWGIDLPWLIVTRRQGRDDARRSFEFSVIDYVIKPAVPEVLVAKLKKAVETRAVASGARGTSGSLSEMSLPDLVQVLWHGRKSGALRLRRGPEAGEVHLAEGMVVNATWGKLRGEDAFYAMLALKDGEFAFDPNFRAEEILINASPESLLLEGMRRLDER
jgi:response regulator RpfG family c-di-GMP phosphodiesterase